MEGLAQRSFYNVNMHMVEDSVCLGSREYWWVEWPGLQFSLCELDP